MEEALQKIEGERQYDLIILDQQLPGVSGLLRGRRFCANQTQVAETGRSALEPEQEKQTVIKWKEVAKLVAGMAANQTLTHGVFAFVGDLPLKVLGVVPEKLNTGRGDLLVNRARGAALFPHGFVNDECAQ